MDVNGEEFSVHYWPGDSHSSMCVRLLASATWKLTAIAGSVEIRIGEDRSGSQRPSSSSSPFSDSTKSVTPLVALEHG